MEVCIGVSLFVCLRLCGCVFVWGIYLHYILCKHQYFTQCTQHKLLVNQSELYYLTFCICLLDIMHTLEVLIQVNTQVSVREYTGVCTWIHRCQYVNILMYLRENSLIVTLSQYKPSFGHVILWKLTIWEQTLPVTCCRKVSLLASDNIRLRIWHWRIY